MVAQMVKNPAAMWGDLGLIPGLGRSLKRAWQSTPVFLLGESPWTENPHGQWSLVGYSPWGHKESDTTERLST